MTPAFSMPTVQNMAGYITARSGRRLAYAVMVNDVCAIGDIERDVAGRLPYPMTRRSAAAPRSTG